MNPVETVLAFLDAINQHDPAKIAALMMEDHVFVDASASQFVAALRPKTKG